MPGHMKRSHKRKSRRSRRMQTQMVNKFKRLKHQKRRKTSMQVLTGIVMQRSQADARQ